MAKNKVQVKANANNFKGVEQLQDKFKVVANLLDSISFSGKDKIVVKELIEIFNNAQISHTENGVAIITSSEQAKNISSLLATKDRTGATTSLIAPEDVSDPTKLCEAIKEYVDVTDSIIEIQNASLDMKQSKMEELTNEQRNNLQNAQQLQKALLEAEGIAQESKAKLDQEIEGQKRYKKTSKVVTIVLSVALGVTIATTAVMGALLANSNNKYADLRNENDRISAEYSDVVDKFNDVTNKFDIVVDENEDLKTELDQIEDVLGNYGEVPEGADLSDTLSSILSGMSTSNVELEEALAPLTTLGIDLEDLKDSDGNFTTENINTAISGLVEDIINNAKEIEEISNKVDAVLADINAESGSNYSVESIGSISGAIETIDDYYSGIVSDLDSNGASTRVAVEKALKNIADNNAEEEEDYTLADFESVEDAINYVDEYYNNKVGKLTSDLEKAQKEAEDNKALADSYKKLLEEQTNSNQSGSSESDNSSSNTPVGDKEVDESTSPNQPPKDPIIDNNDDLEPGQ